MAWVTVVIDGLLVRVGNAGTVLQACRVCGVVIPFFCYHNRLAIGGNCRMCIVDIGLNRKPVISCGTAIQGINSVWTRTPFILKVRENILEFLLINHPLDCPICDQGGECDLQELTGSYGSDVSRFALRNKVWKRTREIVFCAPGVRAMLERCINCTRCVRFIGEFSDFDFGGVGDRGVFAKVGMFLKRSMFLNIAGNIVDLCPVGALTDKAYMFGGRVWDLTQYTVLDLLDCCGRAIVLEVMRDSAVGRVLPNFEDMLAFDGITDRSRYSYDAFCCKRLAFPYVRNESGRYSPIGWGEAVRILINTFLHKWRQVLFIVGEFISVELLVILRKLARVMGASIISSDLRYFGLNIDFTGMFLCDTRSFQDLVRNNFCVLGGVNLREECVLLDLEIRRAVLSGRTKVILFNEYIGAGWSLNSVGNTIRCFLKMIEGRAFFCKYITNFTFFGGYAFYLALGRTMNALVSKVMFQVFNGDFYGIFGRSTSNGMLTLGANSRGTDLLNLARNGVLRCVYLLNVKINGSLEFLAKNGGFVISHGFINNLLPKFSGVDLILPGLTFLESIGTFCLFNGVIGRSRMILSADSRVLPEVSLLKRVYGKLVKKTYSRKRLLSTGNANALIRQSGDVSNILCNSAVTGYFFGNVVNYSAMYFAIVIRMRQQRELNKTYVGFNFIQREFIDVARIDFISEYSAQFQQICEVINNTWNLYLLPVMFRYMREI